MRYLIRPLSRVRIEYVDPHGAAPEPEHVFPLMLESLTTVLSGAGVSHRREHSPARAHELFRADWAAASVFDVVSEFSPERRQALLLALHGNGRADAYLIFLYADAGPAKHEIKAALDSLAFAPGGAPSVRDDDRRPGALFFLSAPQKR